MTNAERQAEWRARKAAERQLLPEPLPRLTAEECARLADSPELRAIIESLEEEGWKSVATISPPTVMHCAHQLKILVERWAIRGKPIPQTGNQVAAGTAISSPAVVRELCDLLDAATRSDIPQATDGIKRAVSRALDLRKVGEIDSEGLALISRAASNANKAVHEKLRDLRASVKGAGRPTA